MIRDTQVLLKKGYGDSDVEKKTPVDPDVSGIRSGSISKLFTWSSLMQLIVGLAIILLLWTIVCSIRIWSSLSTWLWLRFRIVAVAFLALFMIWFNFFWKLLGPVAHY